MSKKKSEKKEKPTVKITVVKTFGGFITRPLNCGGAK